MTETSVFFPVRRVLFPLKVGIGFMELWKLGMTAGLRDCASRRSSALTAPPTITRRRVLVSELGVRFGCEMIGHGGST